MKIALFVFAIAFVAVADEKPKAPASKDEITEIEALRYQVALFKAQDIQRLACEAHPECMRAQAALRAVVATIDIEHKIDRNAGEFFNQETREIVRVSKKAPLKAK